jgi:hypothetical protein
MFDKITNKTRECEGGKKFAAALCIKIGPTAHQSSRHSAKGVDMNMGSAQKNLEVHRTPYYKMTDSPWECRMLLNIHSADRAKSCPVYAET